MMAHARFSRASCPSCGGALDLSSRREDGSIPCKYCGTAVQAEQAKAALKAGTSGMTAARILPVMLLSIGLLVAASVAFGVLTQPPSTSITPATPGTVQPPRGVPTVPPPGQRMFQGAAYMGAVLPNAEQEVLIFVQLDDGWHLQRIDPNEPQVRWLSEPLGGTVSWRVLAHDEQHAFVVDDTHLVAVALDDGTVRWRAPLMATVQSSCSSCLIAAAGQVIAAQTNHAVQAFDAATGTPAWSRRLKRLPFTLPVAGDHLLLLDSENGVIDVIDPATGAPIRSLDARFTGTRRRNGVVQPWHALVLSPDGSRLYALADDVWNLRVLAWDVESGDRLIDQTVGRLSPRHDTPLLLKDDYLYLAEDTTIYALDLTEAAMQSFLANYDYKLRPGGVIGDLLMVYAAPTWDSSRWQLWAVDRQTGERRWQFVPDVKTLHAISGHGDWDVHFAPERIVVVQHLEEQNRQVVVEVLDPKTGISRGRHVMVDGVSNLWDVLWTDNVGWFSIGGGFVGADMTTGERRYFLR